MGEVWKEIMQGVHVKTLLIALLSIFTILFIIVLFFLSLEPKPLKTDLNEQQTHIDTTKVKSTQTNFTP